MSFPVLSLWVDWWFNSSQKTENILLLPETVKKLNILREFYFSQIVLTKVKSSWIFDTLRFFSGPLCIAVCLPARSIAKNVTHLQFYACLFVWIFFANLNAIKNRHVMWKILYQSWLYSCNLNKFLAFFSIRMYVEILECTTQFFNVRFGARFCVK